MTMKLRTCKITFGRNFVKQREGRPHVNRWFPSRKRLLAAGLQVGRKANRRIAVGA